MLQGELNVYDDIRSCCCSSGHVCCLLQLMLSHSQPDIKQISFNSVRIQGGSLSLSLYICQQTQHHTEGQSIGEEDNSCRPVPNQNVCQDDMCHITWLRYVRLHVYNMKTGGTSCLILNNVELVVVYGRPHHRQTSTE